MQELIEDADITEIMVNGTKGIFYERQGGFISGINTLHQKKSFRMSYSRLQEAVTVW